MPKSSHNNYCLNCRTSFLKETLAEGKIYCHECGQANKASVLSFRKLIADGFINLFNIDGKIVRTLKDIHQPSKLASSYIQGKRQLYVNPTRLFLFLLLALISLTLFIVKLDNSSMGVSEFHMSSEKSYMMDQFDKVVYSSDTITQYELNIVDSLRNTLFLGTREIKKDTLGKFGPMMFGWGGRIDSIGISTYDALHMTEQELFKKYKIKDFWQKANVSSYLTLRTNPAGAFKLVFSNLLWALIITLFLISVILKLLYIRGGYFLVEHLIIMLYFHATVFIMGIVYQGLNWLLNYYGILTNGFIELITFLGALILLFKTIKIYYNQNAIKSLIKMVVIIGAYGTIFFFTVMVVALASIYIA